MLSIINRKKAMLFWGVLSLGLCNAVFFTSTIQKQSLLSYTASKIPKFSDQDIFVVSGESRDVLNPVSFAFPHLEKIVSHGDVLNVASLALEEDQFSSTSIDPDLLVISLRKDASTKKWIDTFDAKSEYVAMHSGQYRKLYNKAILVRNKTLYDHYSLLSNLSFFSFLGLVIFSISLVFKVKNEIEALLLEGISIPKLTLGFGFCLSKLAGLATFCVFCGCLFISRDLHLLLKLLIQSSMMQAITIFSVLSLLLLIKRRGLWAK